MPLTTASHRALRVLTQRRGLLKINRGNAFRGRIGGTQAPSACGAVRWQRQRLQPTFQCGEVGQGQLPDGGSTLFQLGAPVSPDWRLSSARDFRVSAALCNATLCALAVKRVYRPCRFG